MASACFLVDVVSFLEDSQLVICLFHCRPGRNVEYVLHLLVFRGQAAEEHGHQYFFRHLGVVGIKYPADTFELISVRCQSRQRSGHLHVGQLLDQLSSVGLGTDLILLFEDFPSSYAVTHGDAMVSDPLNWIVAEASNQITVDLFTDLVILFL